VDDLLWVRFPVRVSHRVTQKLLDTLARVSKACEIHGHAAAARGRNVLARMKRGSNGDAFLKLLEPHARDDSGIALRTSFIVGFPGETENDFEELLRFREAAKLDWMGVFEYSDVDNAESYALDEKVDAKTITDRRKPLNGHPEENFAREFAREILACKIARVRRARVHGADRRPVEGQSAGVGSAPRVHGSRD